jgi:hypothetical protein
MIVCLNTVLLPFQGLVDFCDLFFVIHLFTADDQMIVCLESGYSYFPRTCGFLHSIL